MLNTSQWIENLIQYDGKGRPIYTASKNEYLGITDINKTTYDFIGNILRNESTHQKGSNVPITTIDVFTYDHQNRLLTQAQTIDNNPTEIIVKNSYDALGQLAQKTQGNGLQDVDYQYNIRGWLKQINDVKGNLNTTDKLSVKSLACGIVHGR